MSAALESRGRDSSVNSAKEKESRKSTYLSHILSQPWGDFPINIMQALLERMGFSQPSFFYVLVLFFFGIKMAPHLGAECPLKVACQVR